MVVAISLSKLFVEGCLKRKKCIKKTDSPKVSIPVVRHPYPVACGLAIFQAGVVVHDFLQPLTDVSSTEIFQKSHLSIL